MRCECWFIGFKDMVSATINFDCSFSTLIYFWISCHTDFILIWASSLNNIWTLPNQLSCLGFELLVIFLFIKYDNFKSNSHQIKKRSKPFQPQAIWPLKGCKGQKTSLCESRSNNYFWHSISEVMWNKLLMTVIHAEIKRQKIIKAILIKSSVT